jgi:hypothetical protein
VIELAMLGPPLQRARGRGKERMERERRAEGIVAILRGVVA